MSNTYNSIQEYAFAHHEEAYRALLNGFHQLSIQYFLIGAQARDIHLYRKGINPGRRTRDIDFAVMVSSMGEYDQLMNAIAEHGFRRGNEPYRLIWSSGNPTIDLLPFGEIEENRAVSFEQLEIEISVLGYREMTDELSDYFIDEAKSISIPVPPVHGLFLLKLLAWDDQKPAREKDLDDLHKILMNYWSFAEEEAYERHLDLFDDGFEMKKAGARILGRNLQVILSKSEFLQSRILNILHLQAAQIDPPGQ